MGDNDETESSRGSVLQVSTYMVVAENMHGAALYELVLVGHSKIFGEVMNFQDDKANIHVFGKTTGIAVGEPVIRTHNPLLVELGPGLMRRVFDGIQQPQESLYTIHSGVGIVGSPLDRTKMWEFEPFSLKVGDIISGGDMFGKVQETALHTHYIMLPIGEKGIVMHIAAKGEYTVEDHILTLDCGGTFKKFTMMQRWPIREPRPFNEKLPCSTPLLTGVRVLDTMFPLAQGGTCTVPGMWGCGRHTLYQTIARSSNSGAVVYVGCSQRGNEVMELLQAFSEITNRGGHPIIDKMVLIANGSNAPIGICEASIFTAITTAEYFRDMGLDVTTIADSISRWAEALHQISSMSGEMQMDRFPAYLSSRLANFYSRAGRVTCKGSPNRVGSLTIIGSVMPPGGDYARDLITMKALGDTEVLWALDPRMAQRKHFPEVNWLISYTTYWAALSPFYAEQELNFDELRTTAIEILEKEDSLQDELRKGQEKISEKDQITLAIAKILRDDFLQQNVFTPYDSYCPPYKATWMLRNIITFYEFSLKALKFRKITWDEILKTVRFPVRQLSRMKFEDPHDGKDSLVQYYRNVNTDITNAFMEVGVM